MSRAGRRAGSLACALTVAVAACGESRRPGPPPASPPVRPSILLVTLDTTRADAIGPDASGVETPGFDALAARGRRFRHAYATAPETLPSHSSMMTGLLPAGHGVHQNARALAPSVPVAAERLKAAGYSTAGFVSAFVLARRFGLARGFDVYDDALPEGKVERSSTETAARALAFLAQPDARAPLFLWVHFFDPHSPHEAAGPWRARYPGRPYLAEIAAMDAQLARVVEAFERHVKGPRGIVVAGDHGEGLGDHGEMQHGNLLYESTMRVPLVLVGPGIAPGASDGPVSVRRIFHTLLDWAAVDAAGSLRGAGAEVVVGEAMRPFLAYGWQPQVMAVRGRHKAILAGRIEAYDVVADPGESHDLGAAALPREIRDALRDYPVPPVGPPPARDALGEDARRQLASLGYVSGGATPVVRADAPRPVEMARLFDLLEKASGLFVREEYAEAIPLLRRILAEDPGNVDAALRLATAHSALGHGEQAQAAFDAAARIAPGSEDVRTYLALHYARGKEWPRAVPLLERVVADSPDRLPAVEALAVVRQRQGRIEEAIALRRRAYALRTPTAEELVQLGALAMSEGRTGDAIEAYEVVRRRQGADFRHELELGVLYLAARRLPEARDTLDRVKPGDPGYAMALFKRAQVSVLLGEPDQAARIELARRRADATTRPLIANERLFTR